MKIIIVFEDHLLNLMPVLNGRQMKNPYKWVRKTYRRLNSDIWKTPLDQLSAKKVYLIRQFRIAYLLFMGIRKDGIYIKASALTFFTILSVIPMVALAFGISKGFGLHDELRAEIITQFQNQEQVM
ncbi:MAG: hypothetical protein IH593_12970, partial [Bacteroidales bacterium]|nr:hypothetical protein [Bacteroidales bacterium]